MAKLQQSISEFRKQVQTKPATRGEASGNSPPEIKKNILKTPKAFLVVR